MSVGILTSQLLLLAMSCEAPHVSVAALTRPTSEILKNLSLVLSAVVWGDG